VCDWWKRWKIAGRDWLSCVPGCVWLVEAVEDCWLWLVVVCSCGCGLWASCRRHGAGVRRHRCYRHHRCVHGRASLSHAVSVWFGRRWGRHWFFGGIPCQLWLGVGHQPLYRPRPRRPQDWSSAQSRQIRWCVSWPSWSQRGRGQGESHGSVFIAAVIDWLIRHSKYQLTKIRRTYVTWHNLVKWQETLVTDYTVLCVIWQFLPVLLKKIQHILLPLFKWEILFIVRQEGHVDCKNSAPIFRGVSFCDAQPILALLQRRRLIKQGESLGTVLLRKSVTVLRSHALATVYVLYLNWRPVKGYLWLSDFICGLVINDVYISISNSNW